MKHLRRLAVLAALATIALLSPSTAMAATAPGYEEFDDCPGKDFNSAIGFCITSIVEEGNLKLGSKNTPITDPITMIGSLTTTGQFIVGSFDGGRQEVPGGLVGITGLEWLTNLIPGNLLKVYAEAELAGNPSNPNLDPVSLPLKVRLVNPLLSSSCYIGSNTDPIQLSLIRGTTNPPPPNQPITGANGTLSVDPALLGVVRLNNRVLVDNSFAAPAARGCTLLLPGLGLIDPIVNLQAGLPSPAGTNEARQVIDGAVANITRVYPPLGFEQ